MPSIKIICAIAFLAVFTNIPRYTTAAATPDVILTPQPNEPDDNVYDGFGVSLNRWINNLLGVIFGNIHIHQQLLAGFDTETCNTKQTGNCIYSSYEIINGNCTYYTIGDCGSPTQIMTNVNCVHKCKLPSSNTDNSVPA